MKKEGRFGKFTEAEVRTGTAAGTGKGNPKMHASSGIYDEKAEHGQTIKRTAPLDTSDMELPNERGMAGFGGSPTNLKHSLTGNASAVTESSGNESPYVPNH
jgi:hypothetical protein